MKLWKNNLSNMKVAYNLPNLKRIGLDTALAILGILCGIFILIESIVYDNKHYHFFIIVFFPSILYLLLRRKMLKKVNFRLSVSNKNLILIAGIIFFLSFSLLIWVSHQNVYFRPPVYFLLCLAASISIIIHIFCYNTSKIHHVLLIIFEIIVLGILIKTSIYYDFSELYGQDPWWHTQWIKETIETGNISSGRYLTNSYYVFPNFHLLSAMTSIVSSFTVNNATFFSVGIIGNSIISAIFLFLIAKRFIYIKIALFSTLIFSLSGYLIGSGLSLIPFSLGISLCLIIFFLVFTINMKRVLQQTLFILFSISLIFTHTLAAFIMVLSLIAIYLSNRIYNILGKLSRIHLYSKNIITASSIIFFGTLMLFVWSFDAPHGISFFNEIPKSFINTLQKDSTLSGQSMVDIPYYVSLFYQAAFLVLMFFTVIGFLLYLSKKERDIHKWGMLSVFIILYGIVISFSFYSIIIILPWRWYVFLMIPLSIIGIVGLSRLCGVIRNQSTRRFTIGAVIASIILFSLLAPPLNQNTPPFFAGNESDRLGWTQSELTGAESLYNLSYGRIITDTFYGNIIPYIIGHNKYQEMRSWNNSVFIWRNYYLNHPEWNKRYVTQIHNSSNHISVVTEEVFVSNYMDKMGVINKPLIYTNINIKVYLFK